MRYNIDGREWDCRFLTYYFVEGTADVAGTAEYDAVEDAMDSWSAVTNIDFLEACNASDADIRISWETLEHGDVRPFGSETCGQAGNEIAHAFYPDNNNFAGDVHFDDDGQFGISGNWACDNLDV